MQIVWKKNFAFLFINDARYTNEHSLQLFRIDGADGGVESPNAYPDTSCRSESPRTNWSLAREILI